MAEKQSIALSGDDIDLDELRNFCDIVERQTGAIVSIVPMYEVVTNNEDVENALAALLLGKAKKAPKVKAGKSIVVGTGATKYQTKPWKLFLPDTPGIVEKISASELASRLEQGTLDPNFLLKHPKQGWNKVGGGANGQFLMPIAANDVPQILKTQEQEG